MNKIFHGEIDVSPLSKTDSGGRLLWRNKADTLIQIGDWKFYVEKDFVFDFASVPRCFKWLLSDRAIYSAGPMAHDKLYRSQHPKGSADGALYDLLKHDGVPAWQRWVIVGAVAIFGGAAYRANGRKLAHNKI